MSSASAQAAQSLLLNNPSTLAEPRFEYVVGPKCRECREPIATGQTHASVGRHVFHKHCVRCASCNDITNEANVRVRHHQLFCRPCYVHKFAPGCYQCQRPVDRRDMIYFTADLRPVHRECRRCASCAQTFAPGPCVQDEFGRLYCNARCALPALVQTAEQEVAGSKPILI